MQFSIVVPTLNAGNAWDEWIAAIQKQSVHARTVLVIDSSSNDDTAIKARRSGFEVIDIPRSEFNHGATRQLAIEKFPDVEVCIFLTQDAILANTRDIEHILNAFLDPSTGVAYGRQLPRPGAGLIEAHARYFNYPAESATRTFQDRDVMGMKAAFTSNSFAAYRVAALQGVGGFPRTMIVSEDMYVAAKMLTSGWNIKYCADAMVYHSHSYTIFQELQRYFDIGVFNSREPWIRRDFGAAESEGGRFVKSELKFLVKRNPFLIPLAMFRTLVKLLGYRLGINEARLPIVIKRRLSMQKGYWK